MSGISEIVTGSEEMLLMQVVENFLLELQSAIKEIDPLVLSEPNVAKSISDVLAFLLGFNDIDFAEIAKANASATKDIAANTNNSQKTKLSLKLKLKTILKKLKVDRLLKYMRIYGAIVSAYRLLKRSIKTLIALNKLTTDVTKHTTGQQAPALVGPPLDLFIFKLANLTNEQLIKLAKDVVKHNISEIQSALNDILDFNGLSNSKKCILISDLLPPTLSPTFECLKNLDWAVAHVLKHDLGRHSSYGALPSNEISSGKIYFCKFIGAMLFAIKVEANVPVFMFGECYFVDFYACRNLAMNIFLACSNNTIKKCRPQSHKNLYLFMYDGLKPITRSCAEVRQESSKFYKRLMLSADKILYSSNAAIFGDYVENTYGVKAPRIHFPRYSVKTDNLLPRREFGVCNDEFHVAVITAAFDGVLCPTRWTTPYMVKCMLEQGINVHSYTGESSYVIDGFLETVKPKFRSNLHVHDVIRDQKLLVRELQQYHAGFNGSDHMSIIEGMVALKDREYSDGMFLFMQATFPTSLLVYSAAGLPSIFPRYQTAAANYLGKFGIPLCYPEFKNIKEVLIKADLPKLCSEHNDLQKLGAVGYQIDRLIKFIDTNQEDSVITVEESTVRVALESIAD